MMLLLISHMSFTAHTNFPCVLDNPDRFDVSAVTLQATPGPLEMKVASGLPGTDTHTAIRSGAEYATRKLGRTYTYTIDVRYRDGVFSKCIGPSSSVACCVAMLGLSFPGILFTGDVQPNGRIGDVGLLDVKVAGARRVRMPIIGPAGIKQWVDGSTVFYAPTVDAAVEIANRISGAQMGRGASLGNNHLLAAAGVGFGASKDQDRKRRERDNDHLSEEGRADVVILAGHQRWGRGG